MSPRATAWGAYKDIATALRARIAGGEFAPGAPFPSESVLCKEYGVSRNTLRRALEKLSDEGLIVARPGRGRVASSPDEKTKRAQPEYQRIAAELRAQIESGHLRPGDRLPSEQVLATRHGVGRVTARHALAELEGAGLVASAHGKGRFVRQG